ncbi:MAG TPA: hypothetical protein VG055_27830 [Planctomycetaceae bacterium]|nr:hypothetical protein [Planctomycetaceae bacterium]
MRMQFGYVNRLVRLFLLVISGFAVSSDRIGQIVRAEEPKYPTAQAPPNYAVLKFAGGGVYYVAKDLKTRRDRLIEQMRSLKNQVDDADISGDEALRQLSKLKHDLDSLQKLVDERRVFVTPYKLNKQTDTVTFDVGPQKFVVITADDLKVESWAGPGVKCVLEKTVLTVGDESAEPQLKALQVVHRHSRAPQIVGRTDEEITADERKFFDSPDGRKLNATQRASRKKFVRQIAESYSIYRDFQGKEIDSIAIQGTEYDQNRSIVFETKSEGGEGTGGSTRQRHVKLTVFLPPCKSVALRGCLVGLLVQDLKTSLIITNSDSRDRDYEGRFEIRNHVGPVRVEHVPIQKITNVQGDVRLLLTEEFANSGTSFHGNWRLMYVSPPNELLCADIAGSFTAWCGRMNLRLERLGGQIDVRNEFGDTLLTVDRLFPEQAHRVISEAGRVDAVMPKSVLGQLPLLAATNDGRVETNADHDFLEELNVGTPGRELGEYRNWRAFISKSMKRSFQQNPLEFLEIPRRMALALDGEKRSPGLDLISRGGTVAVKVEN